MKKSNARRPLLRKGRSSVEKAGGSAAGRLLASAGGARATVEQLEPRQLLFALTVLDADPTTGLGTVAANFGYSVPMLRTLNQVNDAPPNDVTEDLNDEVVGPQPLPDVQAVSSNTLFTGSNLRVVHNLIQPSFMQVRAERDANGQLTGNRFSRLGMNQNDFVAFRPETAPGQNGEPGQRIVARSFSFTVSAAPGTALGLDPAKFKVQLFFRGTLIEESTGTALANKNTDAIKDGVGRFTFNAPTATPAFDEIRIVATGTLPDAFQIDDISFSVPQGRFTSIVAARNAFAQIALTGPVGARVELFDLYGRPMVATTAVGIVGGSPVTIIDLNDDGVPDFNDGIGRIVITGVDGRSTVSMMGGTFDTTLGFQLEQSFRGTYDRFEAAGFGFAVNVQDNNVVVHGLPPGPGSVIIGSPFVRDNSSGAAYNPTGNAVAVPVLTGFTRADQGIFIDSAAMGNVSVHGMVFGSSRVQGSIGVFGVSQLLGSLTVNGDMGALSVSGDAGLWAPDPGFQVPDLLREQSFKTQGQLVAGRTVGEVMIGGRSSLDVTIAGDLNSPQTRPPRDVNRYFEREYVYPLDPTVFDEERDVVAEHFFAGDPALVNDATARTQGGPAAMFGLAFLRNDTVYASEWVGSIGTSVRVVGELSANNVFATADDDSDVFGFASDGSSPIRVEVNGGAYARILDGFGRTVASVNGSRALDAFNVVSYQPAMAGVYYVVLSDPLAIDGGSGAFTGTPYVLNIQGMAPVTLGSYRTGGSSASNTVSVLAGNMGSIRVGTGILNSTGTGVSAATVTNTTNDNDAVSDWYSGTFNVAGSLFNISAGSDISGISTELVVVNVAGDLGTMHTGISPVAGLGAGEGDVNGFSLTVGGRIGGLYISGGTGIDQDATDPLAIAAAPDTTRIRSGSAGGSGDIGIIRYGSHIADDALTLTTSDNSTIGALLVSQDIALSDATRQGIYAGFNGINMNLGRNSDVRFAEFPRIDLRASVNVTTPIIANQTLTFIDDGGGTVQIRAASTQAVGVIGFVRVLPVNGSQGVAIGQIVIDLSGGTVLDIQGVGPVGNQDVISIGKIEVTAADALSAINIRGNVQTDVWRITSVSALSAIANSTPLGDLVAVDVNGLGSLTIGTGSLGVTETLPGGPKQYGPFIGIGGTAGPRQTAIPLPQGAPVMDDDWNNLLYRAANDATRDTGNAFLDDVGSPFDPYLNGLIVRNGNLASATVGGAVGDVLVPNGNILRVTANSDRVTPQGSFHGIVGTIYAGDILDVEIGDGLAAPGSGPLATAGIFATNDIVRVTGSMPNSTIRGVITAADLAIDVINGTLRSAVGLVTLSGGGDFVGAFIGAMNLDNFWVSYNFGDDNRTLGDIAQITGLNADFFKSEISAASIQNVNFQEGYYDASVTNATRDIGTITAKGYRNSTLTGGANEFRTNIIQAAGNINTLTTTGQAGDMNDLLFDLTGSVIGEISARSFNRVQLEVDNTLRLLRAVQDIRSSSINVGALPRAVANGNIVASRFTVAGPITSIEAVDSILSSTIDSNGPSGRIDQITAKNLISGEISSTGAIGIVRSTAGDIVAKVTTTTGLGNVGTLEAARDLDISTDIFGRVTRLNAGRHIGNLAQPSVIVVRGDLEKATAGGQLYSDIRVGQQVIDSITIGRVSTYAGVNLLGGGSVYAFGRINNITVEGDFDGNIVSYSGGIAKVVINNGSFLPGNTISAFDGHINEVTINSGNLYGSIHADWLLYAVNVIADSTGTFGDIGINPRYNSSQVFDSFRPAIPVGVVAGPGIQGPRITAGWSIGYIWANNGSMFETTVHAGQTLNLLWIGGRAENDSGIITNDQFTTTLGNSISAGDRINTISAFNMSFTAVAAGIVDLGADGRIGGAGSARDSVKPGSIDQIYLAGTGYANIVAAGLDGGADGVYGSADDRTISGLSSVREIIMLVDPGFGGPVNFVYTDNVAGGIDPRFQVSTDAPQQDLQVEDDIVVPGTINIPSGTGIAITHLGVNAMVYFNGPGSAVWDPSLGRVLLTSTTTDSHVSIIVDNSASPGVAGTLRDFDVVTADDASVGQVYVGSVVNGTLTEANLGGDSDIVIDGNAAGILLRSFSGTGSVKVGESLGNFFLTGSFLGGSLTAEAVNVFVVVGEIGIAGNPISAQPRVDLLNINAGFLVGGVSRGSISVDRNIPNLGFNSGIDRGSVRAGMSIGNMSAANLTRAWVSAGDFFGDLKVTGNVTESSIMVGADLGTDAAFGGTGLAADRVGTGFMGDVSIGGNFNASDIVAGAIRGSDGFFGSGDDIVAEGRSVVGRITITGTAFGSSRNTESYRVSSTGLVTSVTIGGQPGKSAGNLGVGPDARAPLPFQVSDLRVTQESRIFSARLFFNQPANSSSLSAGLSVYEVRGTGAQLIRLVEGTDYTISYDNSQNAAIVTFKSAVTNRDLPRQDDLPGAGVYRFVLDQNATKAQFIRTVLDGDHDGQLEANDSYSHDDFVGDAGDKLVDNVVTPPDGLGGTHRIDFTQAFDLSAVMDDNRTPDSLPDANEVFTLRGSIGDHPDNDTNVFRFQADADVYKITLQAGQILRLGTPTGAALAVPVSLLGSTGTPISTFGNNADAAALPVNLGTTADIAAEQAFLIKTTGTYYILVGNTGVDVTDPSNVAQIATDSSVVGDYAFTVEVFDDGDSGFNATTDAGDGTDLVGAPAPIAFAGPDQVFGTADDVSTISIGGFRFDYGRGGDGQPNTADDVIVGVSADGKIVTGRTGTGLTGTVVQSSIGEPGHTGLPGQVTSDVDVFHLNSGLPVAPGTRIRIVVQLSGVGGDLGSRNQSDFADSVLDNATINTADFTGAVQFAVFDTSDATDIDDARMLFSPTDFSPNGGTPGVIASNSTTSYGFDANGDFYIDFIAPGRLGNPSLGASLAVYLQGAYNTDYKLDIATLPPSGQALTPRAQNVFIETQGGVVDWLEAGGQTTTLAPFLVNSLGFSGSTIGGVPVQDYVINSVVSNLQALFDSAGYAVNFSTNPRDFDREDFSTVYISSTQDPLTQVFDTTAFLSPFLANLGVFSSDPFGFSQHSDPFNTDSRDEAIVLSPGFQRLGYTPSQADIDRFVQSLTGAVGRRVGELLGLRLSSDNTPLGVPNDVFDVQAANSASTVPGASGASYSLTRTDRLLSGNFDSIERTDFFLGRQNSLSLLDQVLAFR